MNGLVVLICGCLFIEGATQNVPEKREKCQDPQKNQQLNSFLWRLDRDPPSYLFGTIHVPYTKVWDYIPQNTKTAFRQSEYVFFELDLTDPYTISALANCQLLPKGVNLQDILPRSLYRRLKRHLAYVKNMMPNWVTEDQRGRGLYADYLFNAITGNWERKRPIWVMLMVNSLTERDVRTRGVPVLDLYLAQEAERTGKRTGAVEEVDEQCIPLNRLNYTQVLFALNQTLWHHEHQRYVRTSPMSYSTDDLIKHYNCGDLNTVIFSHDAAQIPNLLNASLSQGDLLAAQKIDEYFREELIYRRNQRMAKRVIQLVEAYPQKSFFFAFGAGHFLGNNSILNQLQKQGFHVRHTSSTERIPRLRGRPRSRSRRPEIIPGVTGADLPLSRLVNSNRFSPPKVRHDPYNTKKRRRKKYRERGRNYNRFSDLWVRIETQSSTPAPATTRKPSFYRVFVSSPAMTSQWCPALLLLTSLMTSQSAVTSLWTLLLTTGIILI